VAINAAGVVVGQSVFRPVLYSNGQAIPLIGTEGRANGINNHGVVVGTMDGSGFTRAFIWSQQEGAQDLNSLLDARSGWFLAGAGQINDNGQIVGFGFSAERGDLYTPCRLDPIPPRLRITLEGRNVVLSWSPHWPGLLLETTPYCSPTNWQAVPGGTNDPVVLPATGPGQLFRLTQYASFDPKLSITPSGTNLVISWVPPWPDYVVESTASLSSPSWLPVDGATNSPVLVPASGAATFFRLRR
jgi:probable HAF family extracellular repeat protein